MANTFELKEQTCVETPLLLLDCEFCNGTVEHWATHGINCGGISYQSRVIKHNVFEIQTASEQGVDGIPRISVTLANADSHFSELERTAGFKGAKVTARLVFFDLHRNDAASNVMVVFQGISNSPDEITETTLRMTAVNRMNMQRVLFPPVRIERRCPWTFPTTPEQRIEAITGGERGRYSRFFRCGYSAGSAGGTGNLSGTDPYPSCGYTRSHCESRGMFDSDESGTPTRRFGGIEFAPPSISVRSYGDKASHLAATLDNQARYNDVAPLVYGTAWLNPPVIFARNDGNLTHLEVLLGMGEIEGVLKVLVNDYEIPLAHTGKDMTATGWYNVVSGGNRTGNFNLDFPSGDPYGSMAYASVVVPNRINDGKSLPSVAVLMEGLRLPTYGADGSYTGDMFTANPAWVLLDILQRSGWTLDEVSMKSFTDAAHYCEEPIQIRDANGNTRMVPRFQCNLALHKRRTAADLIRGVRNASRLFLTYGDEGKLELRVENTFALQQADKPAWSNSTEKLNGGWPSYEFGDGTAGTSGILVRSGGEPSVRVWSRSIADTPNRFSVEFQDAFNEYQQDSFSLVDVDDVGRIGQEITANLMALGVPNYDQAARILKFNLDKNIEGNTYIEFETSVKALGMRPGDLIAVTYLKEGYNRQPFRVLKVAPGMNYRTSSITAQWHSDEWYTDTNGQDGTPGRRQPGFGVGVPRPLLGISLDETGEPQYSVEELTDNRSDGGVTLRAKVGFTVPIAPNNAIQGVPLVSLAPVIDSGGTLPSNSIFYYGLTALSEDGNESALSFIVMAALPAGTGPCKVTLTGLSFPPGSKEFNAYRGTSPAQLSRIAQSQAITESFTDPGLPEGVNPPPDANYDHANFYWRSELTPEIAATVHSLNTVGNEVLHMEENAYTGMTVRICRGKGAGQERIATGNTSSTLSLMSQWTVEPDASSTFAVAEAGWHFGASAKTSPVAFEIPNRCGAVVQISGRSANVDDVECSPELCTLTRWTVGGAGHNDVATPPAPLFGLGVSRTTDGSLEVTSVGFEDLTNTRTVTAGTLALYYWDELAPSVQHRLASDLGADAEFANLTSPGTAGPGDFIQIDKEVIRIEEVLNGGMSYRVTKAAHTSIAAAHLTGAPIYHLQKSVVIIPFVPDFFGSPASGNWTYPIQLSNVRIASAEMYVTNARGNSATTAACLTHNADAGLRTLSGGQYSIQVDGYLAVDNAPVPDLVIDTARSVHDVFATVKLAPQEAPIQLQLRQNAVAYGDVLTIPSGSTLSNVVDGFLLPPLEGGARLSLEVTSVGKTFPGSDLTVVVRL